MSDTRPYPLDLSSASTRRFPKLAVKNRSPVVVNESVQSSEEDSNEGPSRLGTGLTGASHSRQSSSQSLRLDVRHQRQQSKATSVAEQQQGRQAAKKKSAGVLGFLTLKEPSTSALEEYAEQERRKAAQKNLKSDGVTLPGVSSQRLPDHVPKVNSKWDGLPDSAKRKLDKEREKEKAKRGSVTSFASNGSGDAPRRSYGSLSSKPVARHSQDKNGAVSCEVEVAADGRTETAFSRLPSTKPSDTHPTLRHTQGQLTNDVRAQTSLQQPTPPATFILDAQGNAFDFDLPDIPNLHERGYSSGSATSPESSPRTPAFDAVLDHGTRSRSPAVQISSSPECNNALWPTEPEIAAVQVPGATALHVPVLLSTKGPGRSLTTQVGTAMPVIQEASTMSETARNFSRPSGVPVSPAAAMNAGEKKEVLPWEMFEPPSEGPSNTKPTPESGRLKRFSKLGRK